MHLPFWHRTTEVHLQLFLQNKTISKPVMWQFISSAAAEVLSDYVCVSDDGV